MIKVTYNIYIMVDFNVNLHTIVWSNGLDFAPEFIKSCVIDK